MTASKIFDPQSNTTPHAPAQSPNRIETTVTTQPRPTQPRPLPAGVDLEKETVITGRVVDDSGHTIGGAQVRLLDDSQEFTAAVVASASGDFRFFAAPGTWTVRALTTAGHGDVTVAPAGAGLHEVDIKVA